MAASWYDPSWLESIVDAARARAKRRVAVLRAKHPDESTRQLADRLVSDVAFLAGLGGAATGVVALVTLPMGLPAGIAVTLALEAELLLALLDLYGRDAAGETGRVRLLALWAGAGFVDAAKGAGLKAGVDAIGAALVGALPARLVRLLGSKLFQLVLRRLGLGWVPRVLKLWPVLGAPVGFVLDRAAVRSLGAMAVEALEKAAAMPEPPAEAPAARPVDRP